MGKKFTFYSEKTDVLQSDILNSLHENQSLQDLMKDNTFWLDICKPSQADLNVIAEVKSRILIISEYLIMHAFRFFTFIH